MGRRSQHFTFILKTIFIMKFYILHILFLKLIAIASCSINQMIFDGRERGLIKDDVVDTQVYSSLLIEQFCMYIWCIPIIKCPRHTISYSLDLFPCLQESSISRSWANSSPYSIVNVSSRSDLYIGQIYQVDAGFYLFSIG